MTTVYKLQQWLEELESKQGLGEVEVVFPDGGTVTGLLIPPNGSVVRLCATNKDNPNFIEVTGKVLGGETK